MLGAHNQEKEDFTLKEIAAKEVENFIQEGKTVHIIDVREVDEVNEGKIPSAIHIPLRSIESKMDTLDQSKEYIIVCRSGGRSSRAASFLESHGYHVTNMQGGMLAWTGEIE